MRATKLETRYEATRILRVTKGFCPMQVHEEWQMRMKMG
jgi:hypothetical protein